MRSITARLTIVLAGLALLAAACGENPGGSSSTLATTTTSLGTTTSTAPAISDDQPSSLSPNEGGLAVILPVGPDGLPESITPVVCGGAAFTLGDVTSVTPLEDAALPDVEVAIAPFLTSEEGAFWPQDGWKVLTETEERVLLVHVDESESTLSFMEVEHRGGEWRWAGSSMGEGCGLETALPSGFNAVEWRFDPAFPTPTPDSTTLHLLVHERACASGQEVGDRLVGPEVFVTDSHVRIAFAATAQSGDATCPSNPETAVNIELSAPIGDREVVDGLAFGISLVDLLSD